VYVLGVGVAVGAGGVVAVGGAVALAAGEAPVEAPASVGQNSLPACSSLFTLAVSCARTKRVASALVAKSPQSRTSPEVSPSQNARASAEPKVEQAWLVESSELSPPENSNR
jgi:hypothetical protein